MAKAFHCSETMPVLIKYIFFNEAIYKDSFGPSKFQGTLDLDTLVCHGKTTALAYNLTKSMVKFFHITCILDECSDL